MTHLRPLYFPDFAPEDRSLDRLLATTPWEIRTEARQECFMAPDGPYVYTYGSGSGVRSYNSVPISTHVAEILGAVNGALALDLPPGWGPMTGCFLNRYDDDHCQLGWHADDFVGMDHTRAVVVVSFGEPRDLWWRPFGFTGEIPPEQRQRLDSGSMFVMPPGMQHSHQHRIPKGSRRMGPRVSLTFRAFFPLEVSHA